MSPLALPEPTGRTRTLRVVASRDLGRAAGQAPRSLAGRPGRHTARAPSKPTTSSSAAAQSSSNTTTPPAPMSKGDRLPDIATSARGTFRRGRCRQLSRFGRLAMAGAKRWSCVQQSIRVASSKWRSAVRRGQHRSRHPTSAVVESSAGSSGDMRRSLVRDLPYAVESDQIV